jgi:hypothetical protein
MWYWRHEEDGHRWHRGKNTIGEIRAKYGSQHISGRSYSEREKLGATA